MCRVIELCSYLGIYSNTKYLNPNIIPLLFVILQLLDSKISIMRLR